MPAAAASSYPAGAAIMIFTADKVERRYLIFGATVVWLTGMLLIGTLANGAVVTVGSFLASLALGPYLQVAYTFTAENFPTRLRARGFALADGGGHLGGPDTRAPRLQRPHAGWQMTPWAYWDR